MTALLEFKQKLKGILCTIRDVSAASSEIYTCSSLFYMDQLQYGIYERTG